LGEFCGYAAGVPYGDGSLTNPMARRAMGPVTVTLFDILNNQIHKKEVLG
jgi:hypothetical protein